MKNPLVYGYSESAVKADLEALAIIANILNSKAFQDLNLDFNDVQNLVKNNETAFLRLRNRYAKQFADHYPHVKPEHLAEMITFPYEAELLDYPRTHNRIDNCWHMKAEYEKYLTKDAKGRFQIAENARTLLEAKRAYHADGEIKTLVDALNQVKSGLAILYEILPKHCTVTNQPLRQWADGFFYETFNNPKDWQFRKLSNDLLIAKKQNPDY